MRALLPVSGSGCYTSAAPREREINEGEIRKSRRALFGAIVKRACADRGIRLGDQTFPVLALQASNITQDP